MPQSRSIYLHVNDNKRHTIWNLTVSSEEKPEEQDAKTIASALVDAAILSMIEEIEQELSVLKGRRGRKAAARRSELKAKASTLMVYRETMFAIDYMDSV